MHPLFIFRFAGKFTFLLLSALAVLSLGDRAWGANDLPQEPFVAPAADKCQWTVSYSYEGSTKTGAANPAPMLQEIRVSKSGPYRREVSIWTDNNHSESWYINNVLIDQDPSWPKGFLVARLTGRKMNDDFQLSWIALKYFKGKEDLDGKSCFVYEASVSITDSDSVRPVLQSPSSLPGAQPPPPVGPQVLSDKMTKVWIDSATRLPLQISKEGLKKRFQFSKEIPDMQVPDAYMHEYNSLKKIYPNAVGNVP